MLSLLLSLACVLPASMETGQERPNLVIILSDDQQADSIGALGKLPVHTPALDRLVARGTFFERAYCMGSYSGAVCAPSRGMIMTGRTLDQLPPNPYNLNESFPFWPELLRDAGYQTFGTGKWHSGKGAFQRCFSDGAEIFFGGMGSHTKLQVHDYDPEGKYPNSARHALPSFSSTAFADAALDFLERRDAERPFLIFLSFTAPHDPRTPPAEDRALYDPAKLPLPPNFLPEHPFNNGELIIRDEELAPWPRTPEIIREHLADYYGMITQMDRQIGRVLDRLEEDDLKSNTLIAFASDHGLAVGQHGLLGKQNLYEHSIRAPLLFAGPGVPEGERSQALCYLGDIFPTLLDIAEVEHEETSSFQSLAPCFEGESSREQVITAYKNSQRAVISSRWKLIAYPKINKLQLFDLEEDSYEINDLSEDAEHSIALEQHKKMLERKMEGLVKAIPLRSSAPLPEAFDFSPHRAKK
jgi:arylsulfatase A-like enzyme